MQQPERWLAVLRIAVGAWFIKSIWTKWALLGGVLPVPMASDRWIDTLPKILSGYVATNPLGWYQSFLQDFAIPNATVFAHLTAVGEGLVGIGLTFGLFTRFSALGGLFLLFAYELGAFGKPFQQHGLRLFMIVMMLAFFFTYAGKVWGIDGKLERRSGLNSL